MLTPDHYSKAPPTSNPVTLPTSNKFLTLQDFPAISTNFLQNSQIVQNSSPPKTPSKGETLNSTIPREYPKTYFTKSNDQHITLIKFTIVQDFKILNDIVHRYFY